MSDMSWEHAAEARSALKVIVADPEHGAAALSNAHTMSNLLKDLLPDAPREKSILVAAAEAGLAGTLSQHVAEGMDPAIAVRLTASSFSATTPYPQAACSWAAGELAIAMGISQPGDLGQLDGLGQVGGVGQLGGLGQAGHTAWAGGAGPQDGVPAGFDQIGPHQVTTQGMPGAGAGYRPAQAPGWAGAGVADGYPEQAMPPGYQYAAQGYAPVPPPAYAPNPDPRFAQMNPGYPGYQPRKTNSLAIAALLCGLGQFIGWFLVLPGLAAAMLALIFGLVSLKQQRLSGEAGRGIAVTGSVLGGLGVLGGAALILLATAGVLHSHGHG
jgi:hypothetical protein